MPELDAEDVKTAAGLASGGGALLVVFVAVRHFFGNLSGIMTAGTAWGQARESAAARLMREAFEERDRAQRHADEMQRQRDHYQGEAHRICSRLNRAGMLLGSDDPDKAQKVRQLADEEVRHCPPAPAPQQPPPPTATQETPKP